MGAPNYITDNKGNIVYPRTLAKCVKKGGTTLDDYLDKVEDNLLIKPTAQGTDIQLKDASDMNIQELHLFGKSEQKTTKGIQLLDLSGMKSGTGDGLTYTNRGDGSVQVSGTATSQTGNIWFRGKYDTNSEKLTTLLTLEAGKKYYIKDCILFEVATNINTQTEVIEVSAEEYPEGRRITGIRNPRQVVGKTYNEVIYPLIAESSTAVEWEEYTGGQPSPSPDYPQAMDCVKNTAISVAGKNLFEPSTINYSYNNLRITANVDNSQKNSIKIKINTINATEGDLYAFAYVDINKFVKKIKSNTTYTIVLKNPQNIGAVFVGTIIGTNRITNTVAVKSNVIKLQTIDDISNKSTFPLVFYFAGTVKENVTIGFDDIAIYEGDYPNAEIEEFKEIQSAQPTCELNGIDDARDELIVRADGTGQLVQKIKSYDCSQISRNLQQSPNKEYYYLPAIDKNTTNASRVLSTHFTSKTFDKKWGNVFKVNGNFYFGEKEAPDNISDKNAMKQWLIGNKVKILFQLEEPIVTELSSEEVQKILALHTNKPNTTIWNDQDAEMQVTYVADTKKYIDDKFEELSEAITTSTTINSLDTSN